GSNGKSTVTELTHKLLVAAGVNAQIGGNFGVPVLDYLPEDAGDYYVLELSSFQLDTTQSLRAEIAVILNITEDHMDRYADFNAYKQSKLSIYNGAKNIIANYDDELTFPEKSDRYKVFSLHEQTADYHLNYQNDSAELVIDNQGIIDVSKLMLSGSHNWSNALVAIGIVKQVAGEIDKNVLSALTSYQGLPHRFQLVKSDEGIDWINDSKATNVGATQAAINAIDLKIYGCIVLIAGGDAKGSDLSPLSSSFERVTHFILIGRDAPMFRKIIIDNKVTMATTLQDAIDKSYNFIKSCHQNVSGKAMVLLSPACASFDMFDNYMDRGNKFAEAVNQLGRSAL
ncbi:MAG: UDP-N-acetylmuramoyl-L-alanine--D-glutamate ligase, partial [Gammaproteobacteria bacterium]|nr:UDP-N-acetylmuramoyl-L-alanine--D-glutamate ligase [Gammaproteobacteria bacterium]